MNSRQCFTSLVFSTFLVLCLPGAQCDEMSFCRDPNICYECDSRYEPFCQDVFNATERALRTVPCNGKCVKLKHLYEDKLYYLRTCIHSIKQNIYIRYTVDVCYEDDDVGALCMCDGHYCNRAGSVYFFDNFTFNIFLSYLCIYSINFFLKMF